MTSEDEMEALMVEAELSQEVRDKLASPADLARLEAAGFEVTLDVWREPVARAPYETGYKPAEAQVAVLDAIGEENARAVEALWRLGREWEALALREELLAASRETELALAS